MTRTKWLNEERDICLFSWEFQNKLGSVLVSTCHGIYPTKILPVLKTRMWRNVVYITPLVGCSSLSQCSSDRTQGCLLILCCEEVSWLLHKTLWCTTTEHDSRHVCTDHELSGFSIINIGKKCDFYIWSQQLKLGTERFKTSFVFMLFPGWGLSPRGISFRLFQASAKLMFSAWSSSVGTSLVLSSHPWGVFFSPVPRIEPGSHRKKHWGREEGKHEFPFKCLTSQYQKGVQVMFPAFHPQTTSSRFSGRAQFPQARQRMRSFKFILLVHHSQSYYRSEIACINHAADKP